MPVLGRGRPLIPSEHRRRIDGKLNWQAKRRQSVTKLNECVKTITEREKALSNSVPPGFNPNLPPPAFVTLQQPVSSESNYSVPVYNRMAAPTEGVSNHSFSKQMAAPTEVVSSFSCVTGQMAPSAEMLSSDYSEAEYNQMAPPSSVPETESVEIVKQPSINERLLKVANSSKIKSSEDSNSKKDEMSANVL